MKIYYSKAKSNEELVDDIQDRLDFIASELECPTWMLGVPLRYAYQLEMARLNKLLNRYLQL